MPLNFHIEATEAEAARSSSAMVVDDVLHRQLFNLAEVHESEFPALLRLRSLTGDAAFHDEELDRLASESERLAGRVNPLLARLLTRIAATARKARTKRLGLYVLGD